MAKKKAMGRVTEQELVSMAERYGVADNALFRSALETYGIQRAALESIRAALSGDDPTVEKEYVKARKNLYIHPLLKDLPRHADSANRTVAQILNIIKELGSPPTGGGDEFEDF